MLTNYHMHPCPSFIRPVGKTRTELWSGLWTALDRPFFMGIIFLFLFFFCFVFFFWGGGGGRGGGSGLDRTISPNRESTYYAFKVCNRKTKNYHFCPFVML